jgi:hypothetical protein
MCGLKDFLRIFFGNFNPLFTRGFVFGFPDETER